MNGFMKIEFYLFSAKVVPLNSYYRKVHSKPIIHLLAKGVARGNLPSQPWLSLSPIDVLAFHTCSYINTADLRVDSICPSWMPEDHLYHSV